MAGCMCHGSLRHRGANASGQEAGPRPSPFPLGKAGADPTWVMEKSLAAIGKCAGKDKQEKSISVNKEYWRQQREAVWVFSFPVVPNTTCSAQMQKPKSSCLNLPIREFKERIQNCLLLSKPVCCLLFHNSRSISSVVFSHLEELTFVQASENQH